VLIPGYEIRGRIAKGGMGVVFAARDTTLSGDVAIKTLLLDRADAESVRRFEDEARITARLPHPAIPSVDALGTLLDGRPFLAMKLVRGHTLTELLCARPSPVDLPRFVGIFEATGRSGTHFVDRLGRRAGTREGRVAPSSQSARTQPELHALKNSRQFEKE
jgi:serine/threonine protein kinase